MKFKLTADHYTNTNILVPAGTEIGEGTPYPLSMFGEPSLNMQPLDGQAEDTWKQRHETRSGAPMDLNSMSRRSDPTAALHDRDRTPDPTHPEAPMRAPGKPVTQEVPQPMGNQNPILPTYGADSARQPIIPAPSEHVQPGPGGRPDPMKSPEDRQHDRDVMAQTQTAGPLYSVPPNPNLEPPSEGNPGETAPAGSPEAMGQAATPTPGQQAARASNPPPPPPPRREEPPKREEPKRDERRK